MLKASIFASLLACLTVGASVAGSSANSKPAAPQDARIIVEVNRDLSTLTAEGIDNTQEIVMNNIRNYVTTNFSVINQYNQLANAFAISLNSEDVAKIKQVPGVKSVTLDKLHWETKSYSSYVENEGVVALDDEEPAETPTVNKDYGGTKNASAETMNKLTPEEGGNYYDGEGTTIAILDNEFYFRGNILDSTGQIAQEEWHHDTFSPFLESEHVAVKHKGLPDGYRLTYGAKQPGFDNTHLGAEGSCYFNNKVPYYFDYGGEKASYTDTYHTDFDVSSDISYHGSHVASIASGHDTKVGYYGIAPKAQLICMKVFTNYRATGMDAILGLSSSSGAYDIPIMNALEDCMRLKVDGINMSLGSNLDDFDGDSITLRTLKSLTEQGILTAISAGNSGKTSYKNTGAYANWTTEMSETGILSSYANSQTTMTIASANPKDMFYEHALEVELENGEKFNVAYEDQIVNREGYGKEYNVEYPLSSIAAPGETVEWQWVPGFGRSQDYEGVNVRDKVAIVFRGSNTFADKYAQAKNKGAKAIIIVNNDPTSNDFNFRFSFGEGFKPDRPCCLVLFKDKSIFSDNKTGSFKIASDQMYENPNAGRLSTFTSDGATYDFDLKPDITAPGDYIRGAIPPQTTEDKEQREFSTYAFLSGTSMSSPNFAGAQSVILSKKAGEIYHTAMEQEKAVTSAQKKEIERFRSTVNMRLMSTATPLKDETACPEDGDANAEPNLASPRRQGAGMANIDAAYNSKVYLEGLDLLGNPTGKAKIALRNSEDINNGVLNLSFLAHNEDTSAHTYHVYLNVMRPSIINSNAVIKGEYTYEDEQGREVTVKYNNLGTFDAVSDIPGFEYWEPTGAGSTRRGEKRYGGGTTVPKIGDVFKIDRDLEYAANENQCLDLEQKAVIAKDNYLITSVTPVQVEGETKYAITYRSMPAAQYQSVNEKLIEKVDLGNKTFAPGSSKITLDRYELPAEAKAQIAELYEYGCYLEGYVTFEAVSEGDYDLSMVYMGYYTNEGQDINDAPVVEPFDFEQDETQVYPSDLVNDLAKYLIGKDNVDMGSLWVAGYVEQGDTLNTNDILTNDDNFARLKGFHKLGTDPVSGETLPDAANHLYAGATYYTNTMVIQQFVLRSVRDNYFTITNKATGEVVYKSVLEDFLFGDYMGTYPLYKSHVDDSYLSAGYMGHRAVAIVPLYNPETGESFASGDYEVKFNYLMATNNEWVDKAYTLHIDSEAPEVESVNVNGGNVSINIKEADLYAAQVGTDVANFVRTGEKSFRIDLTTEEVLDFIDENYNYGLGEGRLFIKLTDIASAETGVIVKFTYSADGDPILTDYFMAQSHNITYAHDAQLIDGKVVFYLYDSETSTNTIVKIPGFVLLSKGAVIDETTVVVVGGGCGGNIAATSLILAAISLVGVVLLFINKKRKENLGGKL